MLRARMTRSPVVVARTPSAPEKTAPSHSPGTRGFVFGYRCAIKPHLWTWLLRAWTIRWPLHMSVVPSLAHAATSEDGACTPQSHSLSHRRAQRGCADNTHRAIWRWSQCWMHPQPQLSITLISKILFAECISDVVIARTLSHLRMQSVYMAIHGYPRHPGTPRVPPVLDTHLRCSLHP